VLLGGAITGIALALMCASATGFVVRLRHRRVSYQPTRNAALRLSRYDGKASVKPLEYHEGPVMPSNTNYALYWDPAGAPEYPGGYQTGLNRYFEDLAHDSGGALNTDSVLTQYGDSGGQFADYASSFGGALNDTDAYPANGCSRASFCLTDEQLRVEITAFVKAHGLPIDLKHEYFVLTPPGVETCLEASGTECSAGTSHPQFCAYHDFIPVGGSAIVYADDPYVAGVGASAEACDAGEEHPNNNASDATIGGGLAHEHSESLTDPELNAWFDSAGNEVADKCRTFKRATEFGEPLGKAPDGSNYNQVIDGDLYWYQQEWSNAAGACRQRLAERPLIKRVAPKSGSPSGGTMVTITGANFASPATVSFGSTPATEVTVDSASAITAVAPAGAGSVNVTVSTASGTSALTKKDRFKYKHARKKAAARA
jgi:hypothetical protein